ncbi:fatty-acid amide hydrolase protein [Stemphylium lycopersici]|uniref:amidase n=1 Tax=Stemphylium lycopersici TaxID=183478 RepID=A0A364N5J1_STELY|nr:fatty-acid amide hydrolase protein [Stemphylium lycopersici]
MTTSEAKWEKVAAGKRAALAESVPAAYRIPQDKIPLESQLDVTTWPKESGWFTPKELEITDSSASQILGKVASKAWSAEDVTVAFCKRAAAAQQLTNCLSDAFFDEAIQQAKSLDEHLQRTGQTVGPLHGLPISLKDNFNVKGKDSTVGFTSLVDKPAEYNSTLVDVLKKLGAVQYCKTNVPTAMMIAESVNNTFGRTVNPLNRKVTSGGSSGGESALIAFGGSPLGVGTDIGGSLRIPAACTGIFTLRPSFGRFTTQRCRSGLAGQEAVQSVNGPMGKSLEDITMYSKAIVDAQPWRLDPKMLPIPWRTVEPSKKLKIAVLWNDGICLPTPPVTRALKETVEKIKKAGHEVLDWDPKLHPTALELLGRMFVADGGKSVEALLGVTGEPFRPEMAQYKDAKELGVYDMWQLHSERSELQRQYLEQWASIEGLDAILAPTTPYSSVPHGHFKYVGYTGVYNVVDYSAVSFPCGVQVDKTKDQRASDHKPQNDYCKATYDSYDPELLDGLPVSLHRRSDGSFILMDAISTSLSRRITSFILCISSLPRPASSTPLTFAALLAFICKQLKLVVFYSLISPCDYSSSLSPTYYLSSLELALPSHETPSPSDPLPRLLCLSVLDFSHFEMAATRENGTNKSSIRATPAPTTERRKPSTRKTTKKLPWLDCKHSHGLPATSTDGQVSTTVGSPRSVSTDGHHSAANSPLPSTCSPSRQSSSSNASKPPAASKPMVRKQAFVLPVERRCLSATGSSPSPATRHQISEARRMSSASNRAKSFRSTHQTSISQSHEPQKRLSIVHIKEDVDELKDNRYRPRAHSLAPVPDHLEQSTTPESDRIPTQGNSSGTLTPPMVLSKASTSLTQLVPAGMAFNHNAKRRISNAVDDLENMVKNTVETAEEAHNRPEIKEIYKIIEEARFAVQGASTDPRHLMTTALPLEASSSSSPSPKPEHTSPVYVPVNLLDHVAPNVQLPPDLQRGSVSYDWAYPIQAHGEKESSSISSRSSYDRENEQAGTDLEPRGGLLIPKLVQAAPREHVDFVLRPVDRDESRGRSRRRIKDEYGAHQHRHRHRRHRSLERVPLVKPRCDQNDSGFSEIDTSPDAEYPPAKPYGHELAVREQAHFHTFSLRRPHRRQPIARDWSTGKKRLTATIACMNTALLGIIVGIYAGEVPRIQYSLADERHFSIIGNAVLYAGLAVSTFFVWTLPLLHGRKPYILAALAIALPLQFPQAIVISGYRGKSARYRVGLLLSRAISGVILGFANVNYITVLLDLFGASLQSKNPHQELVVANDVRRHGGGMGMWLGIWSWCWIGSLAVGFQIGAAIIQNHTPDWGFYVVVIILAVALILNIIASETRRAPFRKSITEVYDREENYITRRVSRGEVKLHIATEGPSYWFEEVWAGIKLMTMMLCQPGFLVLALYLGWIYAQVVLVIVLLGALLSRDYRWKPTKVGAGVMSIAVGAFLAIPLTKAGIFSRERKKGFRTDSMTFQKQVTWTSHLVRRAVFTLTLPLMGMAYTVSSAGRPRPYMVPIIFAGAVGFLSILAIAECHGLIMETFDTCDLQPGVNTRHRLQSMAVQDRRRRTNYTSFPRVTAGIFASQMIAFTLAAVATMVGGSMTRHLGAQTSTGVTAGILFGLTILLILVLFRFKSVQVIPNHTFGTRRDTAAWQEFKELEKMGRGDDWKAVVIGNPSGKMRRMSVLELGALSRWTEIRKLNFLIKGGMLGQPTEKKRSFRDSW